MHPEQFKTFINRVLAPSEGLHWPLESSISNKGAAGISNLFALSAQLLHVLMATLAITSMERAGLYGDLAGTQLSEQIARLAKLSVSTSRHLQRTLGSCLKALSKVRHYCKDSDELLNIEEILRTGRAYEELINSVVMETLMATEQPSPHDQSLESVFTPPVQPNYDDLTAATDSILQLIERAVELENKLALYGTEWSIA